MKVTQLVGKRYKEVSSDCKSQGHAVLVRGGYIHRVGSGIYSSTLLMTRITQKIEQLIREEMNVLGGLEVSLPVVLPAELWRASGRWDSVGEELLKTEDRNGSAVLLAMTHEEAVVDLVRHWPLDTAFMVYQIQTKFRDEERPRAGLIRTREFKMKDAYSFHKTQKDLEVFYAKVLDAYLRFFKTVGLKDVEVVTAESGIMGGDVSHELMLVTPIGEDKLVQCTACGHLWNAEGEDWTTCKACGDGVLVFKRGIEVGNIFQLGDRYTKAMGMTYSDGGDVKHPLMACYGIGIGRLVASIAEICADDRGVVWPAAVAPWAVEICVLNCSDTAVKEAGETLYEALLSQGIEVLYDDRAIRAGVMFSEADLFGAPHRLIVSRKALDAGGIEWLDRVRGETMVITAAECVAVLKERLAF